MALQAPWAADRPSVHARLNDSVLHAVEHQPSAALHDRLVDTLAAFETELEAEPRVVTLARI